MKEKIKIGIDIDDVICDTYKHMIEHFNKEFNKEISIKQLYDDSAFSEIYKIEHLKLKESARRLFSKEFIQNSHLIENARESILKLQKDFEIVFITSRSLNRKEDTIIFLNKNFPDNNFKILFSSEAWEENQGEKSKFEHCLNKNIPFLIEDNSNFSLKCAKRGIKVFLMDKPWNKNCNHSNITRVKDWNNALEKINNLILT